MRSLVAILLLSGCSHILGFEDPKHRDAVSPSDALLVDAPDPRFDAGPDAPRDAPTDVRLDAAPDAPSDAAIDAPIDAPSDAAVDAPIDAPSDAAVDAPIDAPVDAPRGCNATTFPGATAFNLDSTTGHCYVGYVGTGLARSASQAKCVSVGGYLPTIASTSENTLVDATVAAGDGSMWIGAIRSQGVFTWGTGEAFSFTNWFVGEPSGDGDCVHMVGNNDRWNDLPCDNTSMSTTVCEVNL